MEEEPIFNFSDSPVEDMTEEYLSHIESIYPGLTNLENTKMLLENFNLYFKEEFISLVRIKLGGKKIIHKI